MADIKYTYVDLRYVLYALWRLGAAGGRWCSFGGACGNGDVCRWVEDWIRAHYPDKDVQILDCDVRTGRATICVEMGVCDGWCAWVSGDDGHNLTA